MKTLSIRQPWAWLIVNGHKDIENRTWESFTRGPILIHAGLGMTKDEYFSAQRTAMDVIGESFILPRFDELPRGGIVGQAMLTACVRQHSSGWFFGPFGFVLEQATPLPFESMKGRLGFWEVAR